MAKYNKKKTISNSFLDTLKLQRIAKEAKEIKKEKMDDENQGIEKPSDYYKDKMANIFSGESVSLKDTDGIKIINRNKVTARYGSTVEDTNITGLIRNLESRGFFDVYAGLVNSEDVHKVFSWTQQPTGLTSTATDIKSKYKKLQEFKANPDGRFAYIFDTETYGGTNKSGIWTPAGITEFSMRKLDMKGNIIDDVNIVLGIQDTKENKELFNTIYNLLKAGNTEEVLANEKYRVTAARMALYSHEGTKMKLSKNGYYVMESLSEENVGKYLNAEVFKQGWDRLIDVHNKTEVDENGIKKSVKAMMDATVEMYEMSHQGKGLIIGQNHGPFDMRVQNAEIARFLQMYKKAADPTTEGMAYRQLLGVNSTQAAKFVKKYSTAFGGGSAFSVPQEYFFDTLPVFNLVKNKLGVNTLYNGRSDVIKKAKGKTSGQEYIAEAWYPEEFEEGVAHMADFDTKMLQRMLFDEIDVGGIKHDSLIDYLMNSAGADGTGLNGIDFRTTGITLNNQLFYAKKGSSKDFMGKGMLNYTYNDVTGEIYTSSNYRMNAKHVTPAYRDKFNMGTNINKGQFYTVQNIKKINTADLPEELKILMPEYSGSHLFQVQMRMAVGENIGRGYDDLVYVQHFASEDDVNSFLSNFESIAHRADSDSDWVLDNEDARKYVTANVLRNGEIIENTSSLSDNELIDFAMTYRSDTFKSDKFRNKYLVGDRTLKSTRQYLSNANYIEKHFGSINAADAEDIVTLLTMNPKDIKDKDLKNAAIALQDLYGYTNKTTGKKSLASNTARTAGTAWDYMGKRKNFFETVLDNLEKQKRFNQLKESEQNEVFNQVVGMLQHKVAEQLYLKDPGTYDSGKYRRAVTNSSLAHDLDINHQNKFEFALPEDFAKTQGKSTQVLDMFNIEDYSNVITVDTSNMNEHFSLIKRLTKKKYGDLDISQAPERYQREAVAHFAELLSKDKRFMGNEHFVKAINDITNDIQGFETNDAAVNIIKAMKDIKAVTPHSDLIKDSYMFDLNFSDDVFLKALNQVTGKDVGETFSEILKPIDLTEALGTKDTKALQQFVEANVLHHYMPNINTFEDSLKGLTDDQIRHKKILYRNLKEQITNQLVDTIKAGTMVPNSEFVIDRLGRMTLTHGGEAITFDHIPKIQLHGQDLVAKLGEQYIGTKLELDFKVGNNNLTPYLRTNLGEVFERNNRATYKVRRALEEGDFDLTSFNSYTKKFSKNLLESSKYEFTPGDWFANYYVGTNAIHKLLPDMFGEHSNNAYLKSIGESIPIADKTREILAKKLDGKSLEAGELDPAIMNLIADDYFKIIAAVTNAATPDTNSDVRFVANNINYGSKDKSKFSKGDGMGANTRYQTGMMNTWDNEGRPVHTSAGHAYFLAAEAIESVQEKSIGTFYKGALFESFQDKQINYKTKASGDLASTFTGRTLYTGQAGIEAMIKNNMDRVLKENDWDFITAEKKANVYGMLHALVNTFEQQKVYNAKTFHELTGGAFAASYQKLSNGKDIVNVADVDDGLYKRLYNLLGDIEITPDDQIKYTSKVGDVLNHGEVAASFAKFGGGKSNWVNKQFHGLLEFTVREEEGVRLTDEKISKILTKHIGNFKSIDVKDKDALIKTALDIFEKEHLAANFTIEDINKTSLPKILINESEKSMNHMLMNRMGSLNENVKRVMTSYSNLTANLVGSVTPTKQALDALFKDKPRLDKIVKASGFSNLDQFYDAVLEEQFVINEMLFGKKGILPGFTAIGNDNLLGHGNKGSMMLGSLNEAIMLLGKYSGDTVGEENYETFKKGLDEFKTLYDKNKFYKTARGKDIDIVLKDGHFSLVGGKGFEQGLEGDIIDTNALEQLYKDINDKLVAKGASKEDQLFHTANIGGEDIELVGRYRYEDGKVMGSIGSLGNRVVIDPETQSGMDKEYIDTLRAIKDKKSELRRLQYEESKIPGGDPAKRLEIEQLKQDISAYKDHAKDLEETGHLMKLGDQELNILRSSYVLDVNQTKDNMDKLINSIEDEDKRKQVEQIINSVNAIHGYDNEEPNQTFKFIRKELEAQQYFNEFKENELTKGMLNDPRYEHLKDIYESVIGSGRAEKLGVDSAQWIYDADKLMLAKNFNNASKYSHTDLDKLIDNGFDLIDPEDYVNTFGDGTGITYDSMVKQNVVLNLGKDFSEINGGYIAVPGMGLDIPDAEVKKNWHKEAGTIARLHKEYTAVAGNEVESKRIREQIIEHVDSLNESVNHFLDKKGGFHRRAQQEIHTALSRRKILTTLDSENNHLTKQAMFEGRSLHDWQEAGIHVDYAFDSVETFDRLGYLDESNFEKIGVKTKQEAIEYYKKNGVVMMDDRYPNIIDNSLTPVMHYLATDIAPNSTLVAAHTALKVNADSDGDSMSRFVIEGGGHIGYDEYYYKKTEAIKAAGIDKASFGDNLAEYNAAVKKATLATGFREDAYDHFADVEAQLFSDAVGVNQKYHAKVMKTIKEDNEKVLAAQAIKKGTVSTIAEVEGGTSILGRTKLTRLAVTPTYEEVDANVANINHYIGAIRDNTHLLKDPSKYDLILGEADNIIAMPNERKALDQMLTAMEEMLPNGASVALNKDIFEEAQLEAMKRIRIGDYAAEAMSKTGISATGNVNKTLFGIRETAKAEFGNTDSSTYDLHKSAVISKVSHEFEQAPISSKKVQIKAGDTRVIEFGELMNDIKNNGLAHSAIDGGESNRWMLHNWMTNYIDEKKLAFKYDELTTIVSGLDDGLSVTEKSQYMINKYIDIFGEMVSNKNMKSMIDTFGKFAGNNDASDAIEKSLGVMTSNTTMMGRTFEMITGVRTTNESVASLHKTMKNEIEMASENAQQLLAKSANSQTVNAVANVAGNTVKKIMNNSTSIGAGLAMGVIGTAAGLMISGYASGNPLQDANAETIVQETQKNPPLDFGSTPPPEMVPNHNGGYIININGDTRKGNRQLKRALKQVANNSVGGGVNVNMNIRTSKSGGYSDRDIENVLNDYF